MRSLLTCLALLIAANPAHAGPPEGCYTLAILLPKKFDAGFTSADISANHTLATRQDLCVILKDLGQPKNSVQTGEFAIHIREGTKYIAAYGAKAMLTDGSGGHEDYVFASEAVLKKIGNADAYARGNRGPIENTIFFILTNDPKTAPVKRKPGEYVGTVTIGDLKYGLLSK